MSYQNGQIMEVIIMKNKKQTLIRKAEKKLKNIRKKNKFDIEFIRREIYDIQYKFNRFLEKDTSDVALVNIDVPADISEKNMGAH